MDLRAPLPHVAEKFPFGSRFLRPDSRISSGSTAEPDKEGESDGLIIKMANSQAEMEDVFRLRYQVYCLERGFERAEDYPEGFESDEYDPYSLHFIAYSEYKPVGTVRLILPGPLDFPIERHCGVDVRSICKDDTRVAEISRLAVSSEALKGCPAGKSTVTVRLIEELFRADKLHGLGIKHIFAAMSRSLERRLKLCGIEFTPAGKPVDYHGVRTPFYAVPDEVVKMFLKGGNTIPAVG